MWKVQGRLAAVLIGVTALLASTGACAQAQDSSTFPTKPVKVIIPYQTGGSADAVLRPIADKLSAMWGQPVVMDYKSGAGGAIGTEFVVRSKPDGYTLLFQITSLVQSMSMMKLPYDPLKDLLPVVQIGSQAAALAVSPSSPAQSVGQLLDEIRQHPGKFSFASPGAGGTNHIYGQLLASQLGEAIPHVAYRGVAPMLIDLMADRVAYGFIATSEAVTRTQNGSLRILAVTGTSRVAELPNVPTMTEAGFKGFEPTGFYGLFAPTGTPMAVASKIASDVRAVLQQPDIAMRLRAQIITPTGLPPDVFAQAVKSDAEMWGSHIRKFGIKPD